MSQEELKVSSCKNCDQPIALIKTQSLRGGEGAERWHHRIGRPNNEVLYLRACVKKAIWAEPFDDVSDTYILEIEWHGTTLTLPTRVGTFPNVQEATQWATLNIPNGTWQVVPLSCPYLRSES